MYLKDLSAYRQADGRFAIFPEAFVGEKCPFQLFIGVQKGSKFLNRYSESTPLPVGSVYFLAGDEPHAGGCSTNNNTRIFGEATPKRGRGYGPFSQAFFGDEIINYLRDNKNKVLNGMLNIKARDSNENQDSVISYLA